MHLRAIKLRGFKSFVDPIELRLEPGVAVVVGPNGSGKSNVADAIVWAAGSLTPSELRAEKPDDVLFGGSATRPAADHCEVELVFDNEDGDFGADLDYSEVAITRRLVRGGEGQYLVNRAPVRRTDLVELLADVGLGGSMHSIVSQGKVDAVLASKPEDRRHLVEEAAGLGRFKRRKHRAELKLARVATQVERARDVEEEVRKRLRPLALQATAAERAEKLAVEIAALRARIAQLDLEAVATRRAAAEERRDAAAIARRSAQERLTALLRERQEAEDELSDAAGRREAALGALYRMQGAAERLGLRRESAAGLEVRLREELAEAERAAADRSGSAVRELEEAARSAAARARDAAQASGQASERARVAHARIAAFERRVATAAEQRLAGLRSERQVVEAALGDVAGGHDGANRTLVALGGARERLALRAESSAALAAALAAELAEAHALARSGAPAPAELEQRANEAAAAARAAATERDDLAERARSAKERLAALDRAIAEREGIPPAARALAAAGEQLALSAFEAEPGVERAVAAALAWRASAVLARDARAGLALLERARSEGLGSLGVVIGGRTSGRVDPPVAGARPLRELVAADERALRLLDGTWLVERERLLDATHGIVITSEGHGYDADRGELWFAGETAEALLLEMDARRRFLADEADELTARAGAAAQVAAGAAAHAAETEAAYAAVAHLRGRALDPELLGRLETIASTLHGGVTRAAAAAKRLEEPLAARVTTGAERAGALGAELRRLSGLESEAAREAADAVARAQAAEVVVARLGSTSDGVAVGEEATREDLAADAATLLAAADAAAAAARTAAERARAADAALVERAPRRSAVDPDLLARLCGAAAELGAGLEAAVAQARRFEAPLRARVDAGAERSARLGEDLRRLGAAEVELRRHAEDASERAAQVQVELARLEAESDEARRRLEEAGPVEPAEGDDRDELAARADRLDARREALGRVNPLAREEYDAEKERLEELAAQRRDLESALAEIAKLRDELARTVQQRFDDTFDAVARNFEEVAATLFPGGEGRLRLVEPEEEGGERGVEVELRPAGKKITRLTMLSGGEKALGAISFLFALFLAKPCPFYLLDEVEAALDDANIARFVELLRRYADRAQFIVITHQKRTMEAADVLYGVTMGGDGISQIVSRRLPQHDRAAATA
ncbi:chromosome segregation protein SMC [Gaiella occulta]|uniref:Chromosome partition protein Smc n=1 Tax=Gaiella occulta TaxID=1002870 RepID=A0A7M2YWF8_9ACTN|nr:chromosome segregation protein SMC [Gaiella occulta]RDI73797.1 chromosome segregation protein SMC [Gaiella occulta]